MTLDYISKIIDYRQEIETFIMDTMVTDRSVISSGNEIYSVRYVLNTTGL
jgi:hypothetical protein